MSISTLFLLLVLGAIAAFAAANWATFTEPTVLSLGVTTVEAPLGLIMLGLLVALTTFFLVFLAYLQTSVLLEARRHARELKVQRELADQAEASRFTELRSFLESRLQDVAAEDEATRLVMLDRINRMDEEMKASIEDTGNTLAAYLGELEDRMEAASRSMRPQLTMQREHTVR